MNEPDLKSLWQSQEPEETPMALDEIRIHAGRFQRRIRFRNAIEYAAGLIVVPAFAAWAWTAPDVITKAGAALTVIGALFCLWQLHVRGGARPAPEASAAALLDFHRRELVRQRDALRSVWLWYLGPFVPGMLLIQLGDFLTPPKNPAISVEADRAITGMFTVVVVLVFAVIFLVNR